MSDALRRALRTFLQSFVGTFVLLGLPVLQNIYQAIVDNEPYTFDLNVWKGVMVACIISGVIALVSYGQNFLEDHTKIPALVKSPPSAGQNPVPDDGGPVA